MTQMGSLKVTSVGVVLRISFGGPPRWSKRATMPRGSSRDPSKNSEVELSISLRKFSSPKKIAGSAASFSKLYRNPSLLFILEAAARKRTGRCKIGSSYSHENIGRAKGALL